MSHGKHTDGSAPTVRRLNRLILATTAVVLLAVAGAAFQQGSRRANGRDTLSRMGVDSLTLTVYESPNCECCARWVSRMRNNGFTVAVVEEVDVTPTKRKLGVPDGAASCHTATIGNYVIEGHVPAADIVRLLAERPNVVGLAAPGMPNGSPGMEVGLKDHYTVVTFDRNGVTAPFAVH